MTDLQTVKRTPPSQLKFRVLINVGHPECDHYVAMLNKSALEFELLDIATVSEAQLNNWGIDRTPTVQIIDGDKVRYQFAAGTYSPRVLGMKMRELQDAQ